MDVHCLLLEIKNIIVRRIDQLDCVEGVDRLAAASTRRRRVLPPDSTGYLRCISTVAFAALPRWSASTRTPETTKSTRKFQVSKAHHVSPRSPTVEALGQSRGRLETQGLGCLSSDCLSRSPPTRRPSGSHRHTRLLSLRSPLGCAGTTLRSRSAKLSGSAQTQGVCRSKTRQSFACVDRPVSTYPASVPSPSCCSR